MAVEKDSTVQYVELADIGDVLTTAGITDNDMADTLPTHLHSKCTLLCCSGSFWTRIFALMLIIFLLILSVSYFTAQLLESKLDLVTKCPNPPKTREEIWYHSYEASLQYGNSNDKPIMNMETQFGLTDDSCWTTKKIDINTDSLWYSNKYIAYWKHLGDLANFNAISVLFGLVSLYCLIILIYGLITLILDITSIITNTEFKTNCKSFDNSQSSSPFSSCVNKIIKYTKNDTTGWLLLKLQGEAIEIIIQSQALLLYNGYYIFNPNEIYLAIKPEFVVIFASILSFNLFGSGILWLSYVTAPSYCSGYLFNRFYFFVHKFSNLFYVVFPFIVLYFDDYNKIPDNIFVFLAQLNVNNSFTTFLSSFFPLILLCNQCLLKTISAIKTMKQDLDNKSIKEMKHNINWSLSTSICQSICKRISLSLFALCLIIYGIIILCMVTKHTNDTKQYCDLISESQYFRNINGSMYIDNITFNTLSFQELNLLNNNPELFLWEKCLFKVYPFTNNNDKRCQCRVLVIDDWRDGSMTSSYFQRKTYFNLTQQKILSGMLTNWNMLEKFSTSYTETDAYIEHYITSDMYNAKYMRAFQWRYAQLLYVDTGISNWKQLEYLKFDSTLTLSSLPNDFYKLSEMKYLSLLETGLTTFSSQICNLTQLQILQFQWNTIESVPHCVGKLKELQQLLIDGTVYLMYIPLSLFNLPKLYELSLFQGNINYYSILQYNLPPDILNDLNDSDYAINEWFERNFTWNTDNQTDYYLQLNPICDDKYINMIFADKFQLFMNTATECIYQCDQYRQDISTDIIFCPPSDLGNGRCNIKCQVPQCAFDLGDCTQLCFAPPTQYSNCSWEKFMNTKCDQGCNNEYCVGYKYDSNFNTPFTAYRDEFNSDFLECYDPNISWVKQELTTNDTTNCKYSTEISIYLDVNAVHEYKTCYPGWVGDSFCDDACRKDDCLNDEGDCPGNCEDDICEQVYEAWLFFAGSRTYNVNNTIVCNEWWPEAVEFFGENEGVDCEPIIANADFNYDNYTNFREFIGIGVRFVVDSDWWDKGTQVNCSACIGMEHYNPIHKP